MFLTVKRRQFKKLFNQAQVYLAITGEHILAVTNAQAKKLSRSYENKSGVVLKMNKSQLMYSAKVEGGFICSIFS